MMIRLDVETIAARLFPTAVVRAMSSPRVAVIVLFGLLLMSTSQRVTPTVASTIIRERLALTGSEFGVLAGISALAFGLAQFPGGYFSDVFGPVRVIKLAAIASAAGTLLFIATASYPVALAARVVFGVADSMIFVSLMKLAIGSREDRRALQIGKVQATVGAGFAGTALVGLGLTQASFPLIFGALAVVQTLLALAVKAPAVRSGGGSVMPSLSEVAEVIRTRQFWAALLVNTGLFAPFLAWSSGWAVPYLESVTGLTADQARLVVLAGSVTGMAGAIALGWFSDVMRRRRNVMLGASVAMTLAWAVLIVGGAPGAVVLTITMTLVVAFTFPGTSSSLVLAKESFRHDRAGMVLGLSNMASSIGAAVLGAAAGVALDAGWQGAYVHGIRAYPAHAFVAVPAVMLAGSALGIVGSLIVKETYAKQVVESPAA